NDGLDYLTKKQYNQAEQNFKAALQIDSSDFRALYGYAKVLFQGYDGREEEALEQIKYAISAATGSASDNQMATLYTLKTQIEWYLKHYQDALQSIEFVITHDDPKYLASDYYIKAKILYESGAPVQDALAAAQKAVSLEPDNADYSKFLSELKQVSGQSGSASVYPEVTPVPTCTP
ncbi:MAG TPA: tetratricopeptide repeat protein, partial [Methanospirillum sp.]|uniref:tetratricopeptide repeat protein n=1 Tax=Methanospirillum sp. TaxID=45200 RepID=UPI002CF2CA3E